MENSNYNGEIFLARDFNLGLHFSSKIEKIKLKNESYKLFFQDHDALIARKTRLSISHH